MENHWARIGLALVLAAAMLAPPATAGNYVILVARRNTKAAEVAASKANGNTLFAEKTLHKALTRAAGLAGQEGPQTVTVLVAGGEYVGKASQGVWVVPQINNPEATLRLMGGVTEEFTGRQPFLHLTKLKTRHGRNGAHLQFTKKSVLKELVVTGFLFDAEPSNAYDARTNSLLKAQSRTYPMISFAMLQTDHLVVDSNIFINGAHGSFDPYVMPLTTEAVVDVTDNFFINNIKNMTLQAGSFRGMLCKEVNLRHNSFILNWPFNPDPTSSNVSAVELYHRDGGQQYNIEGNLFAYNPGGAMQHDWPEDRMPPIAIRNNLFFQNAALFGEDADPTGVFAGKFGTNPLYLVIGIDTVADDFGYTVEGNVSIDPKIPIAIAALQAANSNDVEAGRTVLNDIRGLFGLNKDGGTVAIKNFAPALVFTPQGLPLPTEEKARAYGVQPGTLWKP